MHKNGIFFDLVFLVTPLDPPLSLPPPLYPPRGRSIVPWLQDREGLRRSSKKNGSNRAINREVRKNRSDTKLMDPSMNSLEIGFMAGLKWILNYFKLIQINSENQIIKRIKDKRNS